MLKVLDNVACKYPYTKNYLDEYLKENTEVISFVWYLLAFEFFERIDVLLFYALPILFQKVDKWDI